jgi:hypothetical protein
MPTGRRARRLLLARAAAPFAAAILVACFERGDRWLDRVAPEAICQAGERRCAGEVLEACDGGEAWIVQADCAADDAVCSEELSECAPCRPGEHACEPGASLRCREDGSGFDVEETCDDRPGVACRNGFCVGLCGIAAEERSNVGCTYWAVDLDNAALGPNRDAAAQQYAIVVSNPQPDVRANVRVTIDEGAPGGESVPIEVASAEIPELDLRVFSLGPREVDGSPPGQRNAGTHTALSRGAFRVESDVPVVAYQFNPLENVDVFSNDASLLVPEEALARPAGVLQTAYVVASWPQTIAITDDPDTNFDPANPTALRAFLTIVGVDDATHVRVTTTARVVGGGPIDETPIGGTIEADLDAFDVLNLETDDFNGDFTGSIVEADGPVAVFVGGEASDAPWFETLADRECCADHLEEQLTPTRTAGRRFVVPHSPSRTGALEVAGAEIAIVPEPDFVRVVATTAAGAVLDTSLPSPDDRLELSGLGDFVELSILEPLRIESSDPVLVAHVMASQDACGVRRPLPGGDPSLMFVPPLEQARPGYVFLTPDRYAFDFITVVAAADEVPLLDGAELSTHGCTERGVAGDGNEEALSIWTCQLSFPVVDESVDPIAVEPGEQNDGVHRVDAPSPILVTVWGFDSFVSYSYAGGTELREIAPPD